MPKSKIYIIIDMTAKSLEIIVYIIPIKTSKAKAFLIIENFFNMAAIIYVYTILIITLDKVEFELCCSLN